MTAAEFFARAQTEVCRELTETLGFGPCACGKTNPARVAALGSPTSTVRVVHGQAIIHITAWLPTICRRCRHLEVKQAQVMVTPP